jgi:GPH family glycoside/pentoside/hexuronide:cation symporter
MNDKIRFREKVSYGLGDVACNIVWAPLTALIIPFFQMDIGLSAIVVGTIIFVSKFFDAFTDLAVGIFVDNTNSRHGKARPWLLWFSLPFAICTFLFFYLPTITTGIVQLVLFVALFNLLTSLIYTAINVPYSTLNVRITSNEKDRVALNVFRMTGSVICMIIMNNIGMPIVQAIGWGGAFGIFGAIAAILFLLCFLGTKERVNIQPSKFSLKLSFSWKFTFLLIVYACLCIKMTLTMSSFYYFAASWFGNPGLMGLMTMTYLGPLLIGLWSIGFLNKLFTKDALIYYGQAICIIASIGLYLEPRSFVVWNVLNGLGMSSLAALGYTLFINYIDYQHLKSGIRIEGPVFGYASIVSKISTGLASFIVAAFITMSLYTPTNVVLQSHYILQLTGIVPVIVHIVCIIATKLYVSSK